MITEPFHSLAHASRQLLRNWRVLFLLMTIYAALLATLYLFVAIKEATAGQVVMTLGCTILAPCFFFLLQTASALQTNTAGPRRVLKQSFRDFWKIAAISLPLLALALVAAYLLSKAQAYFGAPGEGLQQIGEMQTFQTGGAQGKTPIHWTEVTFTTLRFLLIGFIMPLAVIHLWIATVRQGLVSTIRGIGAPVLRAFAPDSLLIYMAGLLLFGVIPYLLLFKATPTGKAWLEFMLFVGRLVLVFVLTLFGWVLTMRALAISPRELRQELSVEGS